MDLVTMGETGSISSIYLCEKLVESSMLLERWKQWAKQYGSLINEKSFDELTVDTESFFKVESK